MPAATTTAPNTAREIRLLELPQLRLESGEAEAGSIMVYPTWTPTPLPPRRSSLLQVRVPRQVHRPRKGPNRQRQEGEDEYGPYPLTLGWPRGKDRCRGEHVRHGFMLHERFNKGLEPDYDWDMVVRHAAPGLRKTMLARIGSEDELEQEAFRMAKDGENGYNLVRDIDLNQEILELLKEWFEGQDKSEPGILDVSPGQALRLRLLRAILEAPEDLPLESGQAWVPNYSSIGEQFVRAKFEEDVEEGLKARFGEDRAIAALAVIVEEKDQEKEQILRELKEAEEEAFSVGGDISKPHRRYKRQAREHGYVGCQIDETETIPDDPDSQIVHVNKVGIFGPSPASYWWTRVAACGHLVGPDYPLELLLYADDLEALGIGEYAVLQIWGEVHEVLRAYGVDPDTQAKLLESWKTKVGGRYAGLLDSYMLDITIEVVKARDSTAAGGRDDGETLLSRTMDKTDSKGTGLWSVVEALQAAVPAPSLAASLLARQMSMVRSERLENAAAVPLPEPKLKGTWNSEMEEDLFWAAAFAIIASYAQMFQCLRKMDEVFEFGLNLPATIATFRAGCILQGFLLEPMTKAFEDNPKLPNLLSAFRPEIEDNLHGFKRILSKMTNETGVTVHPTRAVPWESQKRSRQT
ncbi:6-phosphogluconate dehydrogenase, decarboxylating [Symbiodinium microadriaticum]|uniref:6-phosphogluconate dehydrogenase, decarboxylating n=1 Tax=Symbiodinium microadriaticum TaxID=2951 RepID=A0A1Q9CKP6_SYMMI|nr:6-phosphogluconate dehydrogenase, decarboxylating [Symbiodinium microadriaticum]